VRITTAVTNHIWMQKSGGCRYYLFSE